MTEPKDMRGYTFSVGQKVARAINVGRHNARLEIVEVTKINEKGIHLAGANVPVWYPERLIIIEH